MCAGVRSPARIRRSLAVQPIVPSAGEISRGPFGSTWECRDGSVEELNLGECITITSMNTNPWLVCGSTSKSVQSRLFCLPYAGGDASLYRSWSSELSPGVEVCAAQFPGFGKRMREAAYADGRGHFRARRSDA